MKNFDRLCFTLARKNPRFSPSDECEVVSKKGIITSVRSHP